ncbi:phosphate propanoyltransferase [Clostridium sp. D2Q-14]|uniref:phosphate propanoyltransferase n=1 Tax=Anaeromonas gelatinilytica TaxID=2683194 RepID=UPI00193B1077|nr:phosphate propanoyltransferase [Anaeromonas gelatinilytica]MBS4534540.1 phosphate propanoyltransferase [Anaeromonas gelatinilytica]
MPQIDKVLIEKITEEVKKQLEKNEKFIPVGVSNRHIHLSQEDLYKLFGDGYNLTKYKDLSQPGQFAAKETVTIRGSKGKFERVRILGPVRKNTQIEISISDGFKLGMTPLIKESGDIGNTPGIIIEGPKGKIEKDNGVIAALRHIHMPIDYARKHGFNNGDMVAVLIEGMRKTVFYNVLIRVSDKYNLEMHIDMDEANSSGLKNGDRVRILEK